MTEYLKTADLTKICRTCMARGDVQSIFVEDAKSTQLAEMIMACTSVKITENDHLPKNMCEKCVAQINQAFAFKQRCEQVNDLWMEYISQGTQQDEIPTEEVTCKSDEDSLKNGNESDRNNDECFEDSNSSDSCKESNPDKKLSRKTLNFCKKCGLKFRTKAQFILHKKDKNLHPTKRIPCSACGKEVSVRHINAHMRTHTKEKPFACQICGQRFSLSGNLRRHKMTHTGERPHQCNICGKGFIQAVTLEAHMRVHTGETPFVCCYCDKAFKQSKQCHSHMQKKHIDPPVLQQRRKRNVFRVRKRCPDDVDRPFSCDICDRKFTTKCILQTHRLRHGEKTFLCSECGKGFASKVGLASHSIVHTGEKPYLCEICNKSFAYSGSLKVHTLKHTGEKPFNCHLCDKKFTQSTHLKTHLRLHEGIKPYHCSFCGRAFAQKGNLTVHMRTHTGETPFICPICNKGFYDSSSMRKHHRGHINNALKVT